MIGRISGIVAEKNPPFLLLETAGLGYEIEIPTTAFYNLPALGEQIVLHTHFSIREDAHLLYGFLSITERNLFRTLIRITGIGPRLALAIVSEITPTLFLRAVQEADIAFLTRVPGVGKRVAERLVIETRGKLDGLLSSRQEGVRDGVAADASQLCAVREAERALVALGYKPFEASKVVEKVAEEGLASQELIRKALRTMV